MEKIQVGFNQKIKDSVNSDYKEALQDSKFRELCSSLRVSEEILKINTSNLKTVIQDEIIASSATNISNCNTSLPGYLLKVQVVDDDLEFYYVPSLIIKNELKKHNLELFDVSPKLLEAKFENIYLDDSHRKDILNAIKDLYYKYINGESCKGIYLYGSEGVGKTYIMAALMNRLGEHNYKSMLVYTPELVRILKQGFIDNTYNDKIEMLKNIDILVLDDIGSELLTEWVRDEVFQIIFNYRLENEKLTCFTSNLSTSALEKHFSLGGDQMKARRLISRIRGLSKEVSLVSESRR